MGDKDFIKPLLEQHATVHFGKVRKSGFESSSFYYSRIYPQKDSQLLQLFKAVWWWNVDSVRVSDSYDAT